MDTAVAAPACAPKGGSVHQMDTGVLGVPCPPSGHRCACRVRVVRRGWGGGGRVEPGARASFSSPQHTTSRPSIVLNTPPAVLDIVLNMSSESERASESPVFSRLIIYTTTWCLVWLIKSEHSIHQFISCYSTRSNCHRIKKNRCTAPPVARSTAPPVAVCICFPWNSTRASMKSTPEG